MRHLGVEECGVGDGECWGEHLRYSRGLLVRASGLKTKGCRFDLQTVDHSYSALEQDTYNNPSLFPGQPTAPA